MPYSTGQRIYLTQDVIAAQIWTFIRLELLITESTLFVFLKNEQNNLDPSRYGPNLCWKF